MTNVCLPGDAIPSTSAPPPRATALGPAVTLASCPVLSRTTALLQRHIIVILSNHLALRSLSRNFLRNLGGGAKCEIWGAIWVSVAKFGHFVSILHQFESHFCQFWSIMIIFVQHVSHVRRLLVAKYEIWGAIWVHLVRNAKRNLGGAFAKKSVSPRVIYRSRVASPP